MTAAAAALPQDQGPRAFLEAYVARTRPLRIQHGATYWRFALGGDPALQERLERLEGALSDLHADSNVYTALCGWRDTGTNDPLLSRQLDLLVLEYRQAQVEESLRGRIIKLSLELEEVFTTFRPLVQGERMTSNQLDRALVVESDEARRRAVWEGTRAIGAVVRDRLVELAMLRNEQARALGFSDYYALALANQEMAPETLLPLLDRLRRASDGPWRRLKAALDEEIGAARGKPPADLMPWDYPDRFLQSVPRRDPRRNTDAAFPLRAIKANTRGYFRGIGLPVDALWDAADLLPRDGKSPHAFCIGIDNPSDVRVLCNLDATSRWMETALHEFGHAIYNARIDPALPYLLRDAAHTFITEAVAMFFGRLVKTAPWLQSVAQVPAALAEAAAADQGEAQLVFARWALLVTSFEQELYRDPQQDLDAVWWRLCGELQGLRRPDDGQGGDWASKVHLACYPAYYQNYLLGELLASQFRAVLVERTGQAGQRDPSFAANPAVGAFFNELFVLGQRWPWQETIVAHTGSPLVADHWVAQFTRRA